MSFTSDEAIMRRVRQQRQQQVEMDRRRERIRAQRLAKAYERGRLECLTYCAKFHAALPRELRDMVYDQLIKPGIRHHVFEALDEKGQPRVSNNPLVKLSFFDPRSSIPEQVSVRQDIWRYRVYVGDTVAKEVAERWYHTGLFIIDAEDLTLPKFLSTDVWERDNIPAEAVRHLRINITERSFVDKEKADQVLDSFEHLFRISNKKTEILFLLSWSYDELRGWSTRRSFRPLVAILEFIGPTMYRLHQEGYRRVQVQQLTCDLSQRDVTHVFDESLGMFEYFFDPVTCGKDDYKVQFIAEMLRKDFTDI